MQKPTDHVARLGALILVIACVLLAVGVIAATVDGTLFDNPFFDHNPPHACGYSHAANGC